MSNYEIKDAIMLKEVMKQIALIQAKYPRMWQFDHMQENLKEAIEYIQELEGTKVSGVE